MGAGVSTAQRILEERRRALLEGGLVTEAGAPGGVGAGVQQGQQAQQQQGPLARLRNFLTPEDQAGRGQLGVAFGLLGQAINPQSTVAPIATQLGQGQVAAAAEKSQLQQLLDARAQAGVQAGQAPFGAPGAPNAALVPPGAPGAPDAARITQPGVSPIVPSADRRVGAAGFNQGRRTGDAAGQGQGGQLDRLLAARGGTPSDFQGGRDGGFRPDVTAGLFPAQIGDIFGRVGQERARLSALDLAREEAAGRVTAATTAFGRQVELEGVKQEGRIELEGVKALSQRTGLGIGFLTQLRKITDPLAAEFILTGPEDRIAELRRMLATKDGKTFAGQQFILDSVERVAREFGLDPQEARRLLGAGTVEPSIAPSLPPGQGPVSVQRDAEGNLTEVRPSPPPKRPALPGTVPEVDVPTSTPTAAPTAATPTEETSPLVGRLIETGAGATPGTAPEVLQEIGESAGAGIGSMLGRIKQTFGDISEEAALKFIEGQQQRQLEREKLISAVEQGRAERDERRATEARKDARENAIKQHQRKLVTTIEGDFRDFRTLDQDLFDSVQQSMAARDAGQINPRAHIRNRIAASEEQLQRDIERALDAVDKRFGTSQ